MPKYLSFLIIISLLLACTDKTGRKTLSKTTIQPDSIDVTAKEKNVVLLKFQHFGDHEVQADLSLQQSNNLKIPLQLLEAINTSYRNCASCYGLDGIRDTIIRLDFNTQNNVSGFELIDINFDGFIDLRFPGEASCCLGHNVTYDTWINKGDTFIFHQFFSEMPVWDIDKKKNTISTGWHMSAYDYSTSTYFFCDDSLILIREEESGMINDSQIKKTLRKLENNIWKTDSTIANINNI
ncbi:MAG: hypothetical protein JXB00_04970 [Bacteroidales bacterium]|nr:hypothetical protein [Bacteroidales bacterium]